MIAGIGVDCEMKRSVPMDAARFFLNDSERERLSFHLPPESMVSHLLRLWTVKEALYKANPENEDSVLTDYRLADPMVWNGTAFWREYEFRYTTGVAGSGYITVAVATRRNP